MVHLPSPNPKPSGPNPKPIGPNPKSIGPIFLTDPPRNRANKIYIHRWETESVRTWSKRTGTPRVEEVEPSKPWGRGGYVYRFRHKLPKHQPTQQKNEQKVIMEKQGGVPLCVYIYIFFFMNHVFVLRRDGGERERARAILHLTLSTLNSEILLYCSTLYHSTNTGESTTHGTA